MTVKTSGNTQSKTDTVAFSALIVTCMLLAWIAAAAPISDQNAALDAAINAVLAMTPAVVQPADQASESRIVVAASRATKKYG